MPEGVWAAISSRAFWRCASLSEPPRSLAVDPGSQARSGVAEVVFDEAGLVDSGGVAQSRPDSQAEQVADAVGITAGGLGLVKVTVLAEAAGRYAEYAN